MAVNINASTSTGVGIASDNSGILQFQSNGANTVIIDTSGNVGIGVTPSAWRSTNEVLQVGSTASLFGRPGNEIAAIGSNFFTNSSNQNIYLQNGFASFYSTASGEHRWNTAPSGTAGGTVTFTQAMTLDASGNLGIGTTSPASNSLSFVRGAGVGASVEVCGNGATPAASGLTLQQAATNEVYVWNRANSFLSVGTNNTERMRIDSSGNVGIGTNTPLQRFNAINFNITGGGPATSGSAADPNCTARFGGGSVVFDIGWYASGQVWLQNRNIASYATNYDIFFQPNGGNTLHAGPNGGLGYGAGAGGTVTQTTSKSTAVTLNKPTGQITMNNASLASGATARFVVNNSIFTASDTVLCVIYSPSVTNAANYIVRGEADAGGKFNITVKNDSGGSLAEGVVINFAIIKGSVV